MCEKTFNQNTRSLRKSDVTSCKAVIEPTDRCPSVPAHLVTLSQKIDEELGWKAEYSKRLEMA
jgi:UDP-glucose 4-epimerase